MTDSLHKYMTSEEMNQKIYEYLKSDNAQWHVFGIKERQLWLARPEAHIKLYIDRRSNYCISEDLVVHFWGNNKNNKWQGSYYKVWFMDDKTRNLATSVYERVKQMSVDNLMREIRQKQQIEIRG